MTDPPNPPATPDPPDAGPPAGKVPPVPVLTVDYASPRTGRDFGQQQPRSAAAAVGLFVLGMLGPFVLLLIAVASVGRGGEATLLMFTLLMLAIPIALLIPRATRPIGGGWLATLTLGFISVTIICGR